VGQVSELANQPGSVVKSELRPALVYGRFPVGMPRNNRDKRGFSSRKAAPRGSSLDFSQFLLINGQFCHLDRSMSVKVLMRSGEICFLLAFPAASLC
jgi:hypothetical protein